MGEPALSWPTASIFWAWISAASFRLLFGDVDRQHEIAPASFPLHLLPGTTTLRACTVRPWALRAAIL